MFGCEFNSNYSFYLVINGKANDQPGLSTNFFNLLNIINKPDILDKCE